MEQKKDIKQHKTSYNKIIRRRNKKSNELLNYNPYCALLGAIIKQWIDDGAQASTYKSVKVYVNTLKYFFPNEYSAMFKLKNKIAKVERELKSNYKE